MNPAIIRAYEEIALERPHVCNGCHGRMYLSHSHLIPRSYSNKYEAVKENIVYHCMSQGNNCHANWEGMNAVFLNDFVPNMIYIWKTDKTYFWKKFFKLQEFWEKNTEDHKLIPNIKNRRLYLQNLFGVLQSKTFENLEEIQTAREQERTTI